MAGSTERDHTSCIGAAVGTAVVALCGVTPGLAIVLGIVGLTAVTPSLDDILCLGLVVLCVITVVSIRDGGRRRRAVFERSSAVSRGAADLAPW
jgi:hypothetical protein